MREHYHEELEALERAVVALGETVERSIGESVELLSLGDRSGAERLIERDRAVNEMRNALQTDVLRLIATQGPMAGDVRLLAAILEIASELERIGDYAKGIARISLLLGGDTFGRDVVDLLVRMSDTARDMLRRSVRAFADRDVAATSDIIDRDDYVDGLYKEVFRHVVDLAGGPAGQGAEAFEHANYLLWVAHNLERTADRATNICIKVVFTARGELTSAHALAEGAKGSPAAGQRQRQG